MHSPKTHSRPSWKTLGLLALLACALPAAGQAADQDSDPAMQRSQAVAQYVTGARQQLDAYRSAINADTNPADQKAIAEAKDKLAACDQLLDQLKSADQSQFDPVKASYERARDDLARAMPSKS